MCLNGARLWRGEQFELIEWDWLYAHLYYEQLTGIEDEEALLALAD